MSEDTRQATGGGISFLGALTILFVGLKLLDLIAWSWIWVLAPIWLPFCIVLAFAIVCVIFIAIFD